MTSAEAQVTINANDRNRSSSLYSSNLRLFRSSPLGKPREAGGQPGENECPLTASESNNTQEAGIKTTQKRIKMM